MTDNEIIKALECCKPKQNRNCGDCPAYDLGNFCAAELKEKALDLISRQKAEIEMLNQRIKIAQSEAVKELVKSLIDKTHGGKISSTDILDFAVDYLRGENNGK